MAGVVVAAAAATARPSADARLAELLARLLADRLARLAMLVLVVEQDGHAEERRVELLGGLAERVGEHPVGAELASESARGAGRGRGWDRGRRWDHGSALG